MLAGAFANGLDGITNATAIGANSQVFQSNSLVLGNGVNVGIGTSAPVGVLHLNGNSGNFALTFTNQANTSGRRGYRIAFDNDRLTFQQADDSGGFVANQMMINQASGFVGINTTSPDAFLTVNGGASKPGGGSWTIFSDERLKNIKGRYTPGLKAVMQLQPIRYEYKPNNALEIKSEGESIGFSAQAVQKIVPEAVIKESRGYLLVNNDPIMWTMLNAIKEQQAQIERQQRTLGEQQKQIEGLRKVVCRSRRRTAVCK